MFLIDVLKILKEKSKNVAYRIGEEFFTYENFYNYVKNIYFFILKEIKLEDKRPIIVYGSKEIYMKASFLACLFAGVPYVPIDRSIPKERIEYIIETVKPSIIIGDYEYKNVKNISKDNIFNIMLDRNDLELENIYLKPNDISYIIFTSGSTGKPKGVKVSYKNLDSCINWLRSIIDINDNDVILNQANFSFDLSVADLYLSIVCGAEHFVFENKIDFDLKNMFDILKKSNASIAVMTPSFMDLLLLDRNFGREILPKLKQIIFCGEKLTDKTCRKIFDVFGDIKIINSYGPTECTFAVTSVVITKDMLIKNLNSSINLNLPVGFVKDGTKIKIVDENLKELSSGEKGEILIIGESVALGYIGINSRESFISYKGEKGYLTGDIGYTDNIGCLYYESRNDTVVKYKGYRVDLLDIENNLLLLDLFENVKVLDKKDNEGKTIKIIAFVKLKDSSKTNEMDLIKNKLLEKIPEYMCPVIKVLDEFPINNNGKLDIQVLRSMINGK